MSNDVIVGRCLGCRHDFRTGNCGGCGAVPSLHERQCDGEDTDECALCGSGEWALMCDDCRFYAAQDAEPIGAGDIGAPPPSLRSASS